MMCSVRPVIHLGTCPACTHSCRCCLSLGCRLVAFLNQNACTWHGPAAFQLDILSIACFSSFTVIITFSCLGVSLVNYSESLLCSTGPDHNLLQNSADPFESGTSVCPLIIPSISLCNIRLLDVYYILCFTACFAFVHTNEPHCWQLGQCFSFVL